MSLVKEYFNTAWETWSQGKPKVWVTDSTVVVLRFDDNKKLSLPKLAELFSVAAKDYPKLNPAEIKTFDDHVEFYAKPKAGYKKLPPVIVAAQG